ncbi:hypothetical protein [Mycolicibacterium frederiksbergense]|uniref:Uncharacterized protein n=1 Tax=Mycolicibacterium frederiksbergense TaxID=117567 RepID=A0A6H0RZ09_9MYCO|nr:hypothetical protein [Mycolicibacterium frederiksbergense]QIV79711.1 hypothetical protein EXE63_01425 [Mycolicibacterium frederiksbergense]
MPSATPIYDALAEQMLGPLTDFVPQWLIVAPARHLRPTVRDPDPPGTQPIGGSSAQPSPLRLSAARSARLI